MGGSMFRRLGCVVGLLTAAALTQPAHAFEHFAAMSAPGVGTLGASADSPPTGIYMVDQSFAIAGPDLGPTPALSNGPGTARSQICFCVHADVFLFSPGWNFLGARYTAIVVFPFVWLSGEGPGAIFGFQNTVIIPVQLSWKLGDSGFYVKTELGIYIPDGNINGPAGISGIGSPWWTFQPALTLSYLKNGWNFTAYNYIELYTQNPDSGYTTGDIFHSDLTATYTIGKWTFGPVASFVGQISGDSCNGNSLCVAEISRAHVDNYSVWQVGGLLGYNFGPVTITAWDTYVVSQHNNLVGGPNGTIPIAYDGANGVIVQPGNTFLVQVNFALWTPPEEAPVPKRPLIYK
jgi:hypothetical protein